MNSKRKPIPQFGSEDEEREFWATHDSAEYLDWSKAERNPTFSRLKPSTRTVSIRSIASQYDQQTTLIKQLHRLSEETSKEEVSRNE